ncbi:MAG TPA: glycoside hydrolase family 47 protein [Thermoanaerobaculia bacterium]
MCPPAGRPASLRTLAGMAVLAAMMLAATWPERPERKPLVAPIDRAELAGRVKADLVHSWKGYERYAWGHDELQPVSRTGHDWYGESLLMTPVDALDTLWLAGLTAEAERAKRLILTRLSFDRNLTVKNFEVTIRLLGGLLSAYQLTADPGLLRLADDLGTRLLPAFASPTGMPYMFVNLKTGKASGARSNPAEIGTLLLEFGTLSKLTGKAVFYDKPKRALLELAKRRSAIGLVGDEIDVETGAWISKASHVGGGIDSYYEYLIKCARLFGDADCARLWGESRVALDRYLADDLPTGLWYGQADMDTGLRTATEFGALHAFLPAVLTLAGDMPRASRLGDSCFRMWNLKGVEPELIDYRTMKILSPGYPLRPEIMESTFFLYRATGNQRYQDMGRTFLEALERRCRTDAGFTVLTDVVSRKQGDLMPSYFLAETLKYLYLLFAPAETLDLEHQPQPIVLNTEAHPLRKTW